ncbi:MAG: RNA chaperone Hfq [Bryobacteraceae bacterium]|nr:RNA chaperone Hfq [Bryobacteraceae bacterium]
MASSKTKAPEQTLEEIKFLKKLVEKRAKVRLRLTSDEEIDGMVEFYDESFLRLTRDGEPNLFVFKHDIKYLWEVE